MVADAALEAAGVEAVIDRRMGMAGRVLPASSAPAPVPPVVPLGLVPQRAAGRDRSGPRGRGGRGHRRPARILGRARHAVGAAVQRARDRAPPRSRAVGGHGARLRGRLGHHDRRRRPHGPAWVLLPLAVLVSGMAPSMISFAAGQAAFTLTGDHPVQHHPARRLEGRADQDRGRGHRLRGQHRRRVCCSGPGARRRRSGARSPRRSWPVPATWPTRWSG